MTKKIEFEFYTDFLVNEVQNRVIYEFSNLVYESFKLVVADAIKDAKDPEEIQPELFLMGAYVGLARIVSLNGKIGIDKSRAHLDECMQNVMKNTVMRLADSKPTLPEGSDTTNVVVGNFKRSARGDG